jgi:hypothetical protein
MGIMVGISTIIWMLMAAESRGRSFNAGSKSQIQCTRKEDAKLILHMLHVIMLIPKNAKPLLALRSSASLSRFIPSSYLVYIKSLDLEAQTETDV